MTVSDASLSLTLLTITSGQNGVNPIKFPRDIRRMYGIFAAGVVVSLSLEHF
jgi:hypothetical protein